MGLIEEGDTSATIFANKTYNRDRGYGATTDVFVKHSGVVDHNLLDISDLELSEACKLELLEAIRRRENKVSQDRVFTNLPLEARVIRQIEGDIADTA